MEERNVSAAALSWFGNAAKMRIVDQIANTPGPLTVFDYGAGSGAGWAATLAARPDVRLVCYEPSSQAAKIRERVPAAEVHTGDEIDRLDLQADFIVSFSVFEHVWDRAAYLGHAKRLSSQSDANCARCSSCTSWARFLKLVRFSSPFCSGLPLAS